MRTKRFIGICLVGLFVFLLGSHSLLAQESEGRIDVGETQIFYHSYGSGPPLLLVHGFFSTGELWTPFIEELSSHYHVIVPDMRGHGRSSNPSPNFVHRESAADMLALLDHLGVGEVRAIGHSSGAMTLIHAATKDPDRFRSLVLLGGTAYFPETARTLQGGIHFAGFPPELLAILRRWHPGGDDQIRRLVAQANATAESYEDMNFTPPLLGTISAETLIVHGDRDEHFPVEIALEMYRAIPHSYLWVVPNGNHALVFNPWGGSFPGRESFLRVLQDFLSGKWSAR